ncbi:MAG: hypothetical protein RL125_669, partial [Actinomycetota bacterium]
LGAGDVTHLAGEILERLHERNS